MSPSKKLKILFVTSELFPFVKTGGLADVSAALPRKLTELGHEVRIAVPKYGAIDSRKYKIHDVVRLKDLTVNIGDKEVMFSVKSSFLPSQKVRVQIYFIDNQEYYGSRKSLYYDPLTGKDYEDNDERFILFAKSIFQLVKKLGWIPDIIHCNEWYCGLVPVYKQSVYKDDEQFQQIKVLFTVHNFFTQGIFPIATFAKTGLPDNLKNDKGVLHEGKVNFLKSGLLYADYVNTVSEGYMKETLKDAEISGGLNKVLRKRKDDLAGLPNGIDYNVWNPEKDKFIPKKFSLNTIENKQMNKQKLVERFGFKYDPKTPVVSFIGKLLDYKGIDLISESFEKLMKRDIQFILVGTGDRKYHKVFDKLSKKFPDKFSCYLGFSDELGHLVEAGSDMFLMPSKYEPCGLNQMYSQVYGTVPIVRQTGGLADSVEKFNQKAGTGTGFIFKEYNSDAMLKELDRAIKLFKKQDTWMKIVRNGMKTDFSWVSSAKKYIDLYKTVLNHR